jgi:polyisoprenoid-binding protein YceI
MLRLAVAILTGWLTSGNVRADPTYTAKAGTIAFTVGSNIPFLKVTGSSSAAKGSGEASVAGNTATIRNLRFELDPNTLKTGMKLRDEHLYQKVFTAADGSIPRVVLQAARFKAIQNPKSSKWEGLLNAQLTIRGVTKPVSFIATLEKSGNGAVVNAQATVKTSDFGVKQISYAGATVNDDVAVTVSHLNVQP